MITFRNIIGMFDVIANKHYEINSFHSGMMDEVDINKLGAEDYTILYIEPSNATINQGSLTYNFNIYVMDMISEDVASMDVYNGSNDEKQRVGRVDAYSELLQVLQDVINEFKQSVYATSWVKNPHDKTLPSDIVLQVPINADPFTARFNNLLTGWTATLSIEVNNTNSLCDVPIDPND